MNLSVKANDLNRQVKPLLRGWLHTGALPFVFLGCLGLVVVAPTLAGRVASAVFLLTSLMLFGCSALYHRLTWGAKGEGVMRRIDHSNIALIIAGTYTPLAVLLLSTRTATILLWIVWLGAITAIALRVLWLKAPRWSYVPIYLALGWVAIGFLGQFWREGGAAVVWLLLIGGVAYTAGAIVYGLKKPILSKRFFGFHELFHALTLVGYWCTYAAVWVAVSR
jgi:hemolysin III